MAMTAYRTLGCRDIARVDIMLDGDRPMFLEINTMPGFTSHSLVPKAAKSRGMPMPELCARLAEAAMERAAGTRASARLAAAHDAG
jgi:D-alanine-D-alanine ligase